MKYRSLFVLAGLVLLVTTCKPKSQNEKKSPAPLNGTYEVVTDASNVSFTSIKNKEIPVSGNFEAVSGSLSIPKEGKLTESTGSVEIDLTSLDTANKERDQNILKFFFEAVGDNIVAQKATYEINKLKVEDGVNRPLEENDTKKLIAVGQMKVHESSVKERMDLLVTRTSPNRIHVTTHMPFNFEIKENYEMVETLNAMMEACDHGAISNAVPVQMNLVFEKSKGK